jgi:RND family efflux transporter MFP subunit
MQIDCGVAAKVWMRYCKSIAGLLVLLAAPFAQSELATAPVQRSGGAEFYIADGAVEAMRQTIIAAQVPGRVTALAVEAGAAVAAGQELARIDARAAAEQWAASRAQLAAAQSEYERSRRLFEQQFISRAAMDRAEAQYKSLRAQAQAAGTLTEFHTIKAPYVGIVAAVHVELGDMAQPGRALFTVYDPAALRATVTVPESIGATLQPGAAVQVEIPGAAPALRRLTAQKITVLPGADPLTHTVQIRLELPAKLSGLVPGQFARAYLAQSGIAPTRLTIPARAVLKRSEFHGVYVVDAEGRAQLRQVRLGRTAGDRIEVLAGLAAGERVALDPLAAARQREARP